MRRRELLGLLWSMAFGCAPRTEPARPGRGSAELVTRGDARRHLTALAASYQALMRAHGEHEWSRYAGKLAEGPEAQSRMAELRAKERELFLEAQRVLDHFGSGVISPRQEALWRSGALGLKLLGDPRATELADALEATINAHRYVLDGKALTRGELTAMRYAEDPLARRRVRQLEHELHQRAAPVARELLQRRNALAGELGLPSFYSALLELRGVTPPRLGALLGELSALTFGAFQQLHRALQKAAGGRWITAWDLDFALRRRHSPPEERFTAEAALPFARAVFRAFGVDLEKPKIDVTLRDFAFSGQAISVQVPNDVRLVVTPQPGSRFYGTLIHELGHAFAATRTRPEHVLYAGYEWVPGLTDPGFAEGLAEVFGRLLDEPRVLKELVGLDAAEADRLIAARRDDALMRVARGLMSVTFERAALERPGQDLDQLSLALEGRFTGAYLPPGTEPVWATSPFLATYPVYTHAYLLAAMFAVQVRDALKQRFGERWISPEAGSFIAETLVADGARWTLDEKLVRGTGSVLTAQAFAHFLNAR